MLLKPLEHFTFVGKLQDFTFFWICAFLVGATKNPQFWCYHIVLGEGSQRRNQSSSLDIHGIRLDTKHLPLGAPQFKLRYDEILIQKMAWLVQPHVCQ